MSKEITTIFGIDFVVRKQRCPASVFCWDNCKFTRFCDKLRDPENKTSSFNLFCINLDDDKSRKLYEGLVPISPIEDVVYLVRFKESMKYLFKDIVIDEDLYQLFLNYGDVRVDRKNISKNNIVELCKGALEKSKKFIPELYNETRKYPPFLYYMILAMLYRNDNPVPVKWSEMNKEQKEETVKKTYTWLEGLISEIRKPSEEEIKMLGDKTYIKIV
jgi:hypothetical protein